MVSLGQRPKNADWGQHGQPVEDPKTMANHWLMGVVEKGNERG